VEQNDEISLLDLLVIMAENWLLLFLVPLAVGAITFALLQAQPQYYRASAVIALPAEEITRFIKDDELAPLPQIELVPTSGQPGLFVSSNKDSTSSLSVTLPSRNEAQATMETVLAALERGAATGELRQTVGNRNEQIATLEETVALRDRIAARLEQSLDDINRSSPFESESYALTAMALAQVLNGRGQDDEMLTSLRAEIAEGQSLDTGLSVTLAGRSPALVSVLAILATGFVMLIAVFAIHGLKSASRDPSAKPKLDRIRNALLLRRRG